MIAAARILAIWLTPAMWLTLSTLILSGGADGLWVGLLLVVGPLAALCSAAGAVDRPSSGRGSLFPGTVLFFVFGFLLWANLILAGDVAAALGAPRWQGIAPAALAGVALTPWRSAERLSPLLVAMALVGVSVPLLVLALASGVGPAGAWERVASRPAFRFAPGSPWATEGRDLRVLQGRTAIHFDEEHRVTAPAGGTLRVRAKDGGRTSDREWDLSPGQSVTLRPGDEVQVTPGLRLRFEAAKRVPGAPPSGVAWAVGSGWDLARSVGLAVTLVGGALGLFGAGAHRPPSRPTVGLVGGGLIAAFLVAQGWAIYSALAAPDLFLGGVHAGRLIELPALALGEGLWAGQIRALLIASAGAAFLASSAALRGLLGSLDTTRAGEITHDLGLWAGLYGAAGVASLWPFDPWPVILVALGLAASTLAPAILLPAPAGRPRVATVAGLVGLVLFGGLFAAGQLRGSSGAGLGLVWAYPAIIAAPAAALILWLARRRAHE